MIAQEAYDASLQAKMDAEGAKTNLTDLIEDIMDFLLTTRAHPDGIRELVEDTLATQMSRTPEEIKGIWSENKGFRQRSFAIRRNLFHFAIL